MEREAVVVLTGEALWWSCGLRSSRGVVAVQQGAAGRQAAGLLMVSSSLTAEETT